MRRSKVELYVHFVWATYRRNPWILPEFEQRLYAAIRLEANNCGAEALAIGGMPEHVHLVLKKPPTISESALMQRIKGTSSTIMRQKIIPAGEPFHWQENYGVFSFHVGQADKIIAYVENQKRHHSEGPLRPAWEENDEEGPT
jgi:REP element-mobilizing transposase RayT